MATEAVTLRPDAARLRGHAEIGGGSLIPGTSGALLQTSSMPASLLLVPRMALAGLVLGRLVPIEHAGILGYRERVTAEVPW